MIVLIKKFVKKIGIDGAVAFTILTRLIQAGGGLISIALIAKFLSKEEQGYYYTFGSILAIQIFFELGLSGIITQYTAHEFAHLKWDGYELTGDDYNRSRLSSLLIFCIKWFGVISLVLFFALVGAGYYFFNKFCGEKHFSENINWQYPWIILCATTSLNLFIDPLLAYFDGLDQVKDMAKVRLLQKSVNIILLFIFFVLGFKLYSAALASLIAIACNYVQILFTGRIKYLKTIWKAKGKWVLSYYKEIFPLQWRIAVSWISGYFIFQLFNPVLFATAGPIAAGQMGMTIAALSGVASISMSWISTKVPLMSSLIAKKKYPELDLTFRKIFVNSMGINVLCVVILVVFVEGTRYYNLTTGYRFLALSPLLCMCAASIGNQAAFAFATYLRCHKKEPLLAQSVAMGVLVCSSTFLLGHMFGTMGIVVGYAMLTCLIGLTWTIYVFVIKKKEWHNE